MTHPAMSLDSGSNPQAARPAAGTSTPEDTWESEGGASALGPAGLRGGIAAR
jgi:hypothetical protein